MVGEAGDLLVHLKDVEQSAVDVDLAIAVGAVGIVHRLVRMGAGVGEHIEDVVGGEVGLGLQPQGNGSCHHGRCHAGAALRCVVEGLALVGHLVGECLADGAGHFHIAVEGGVDAHAGCHDIGLGEAVEGGALRGEAGYLAGLVGGEADHFVVRLAIDVFERRLIASGSHGDDAGHRAWPPCGIAGEGVGVGGNVVDVGERAVFDVGIDPGGSVAGEEEEGAAEHEIGQVGHVAMEVEHVAARVLVVALPDFQVDVAQGDGGGEPAGVVEGQHAVGSEGERLLDVCVHEADAEEVEAHLLVDGCDDVEVDGLSASDAVDDGGACLQDVGRLLHIGGVVAVVAGAGHDDASWADERLEGFGLQQVAVAKGVALTTAEVDDAGLAVFRSLVE